LAKWRSVVFKMSPNGLNGLNMLQIHHSSFGKEQVWLVVTVGWSMLVVGLPVLLGDPIQKPARKSTKVLDAK